MSSRTFSRLAPRLRLGANRVGWLSRHHAGTSLVRTFLRLWDAHAAGQEQPNPFLSLVQAVCSSPQAADSLREFIAERIAPQAAAGVADGEWRIRHGLIGSQLIGLGFRRYILRAEPVASAEAAQIADWVGPAIDRYLHEPITGVAGQR